MSISLSPLITCLLLMVLPVSSYGQQCTRVFTKEGILSSLRKRVLRKGDLKFVAEQLQQCGVNFELKTPADEQEIRRAGNHLDKKGVNYLLAAIKSNYRPDVTQQSAATPTSEVKVGGPKPNLIPVGYLKLHIVYDPVTQTFKESNSGILAIMAQFRNAHDFDDGISEANDIRAHIYYEPLEFYKNLDRSTPGFAKVDNGIWLDEKHFLVDFTRGDTKTLILAVQMPDGGFGGFDHRIETREGKGLLFPRVPVLTADRYVVKVELTGGARTYELHHFMVTLRPDFNIYHD